MKRLSRLTLLAIVLTGSVSSAQGPTIKPSDVTPFIGTWVFNVPDLGGALETVRIWDKNGTVTASVQAARFPPIEVSGILKDGDMLVLTVKRFENGEPIWAVISLIPEGETMKMAQMLEFSQTIKRGTGKKESR